jgi:uncharacterized phage protein gp47/JayE
MADYPVPNLDEQTRRIVELYRALIPDIDTSEAGIAYRDARVMAGATTGVHAHVEAVDRDAIPTTAEGEALVRWGSFRGVLKKGASTATGPDALRVRGTPGAVVTVGLALRDRTTGVEAETTSGVTLDVDGEGTVSIETTTTGAQANLPLGSTLDFLAPPTGVNQAAALVAALSGGEDEESDGAYRARVVNRFASPPQGGNQNDFEQWVLLVAGIDAGFALPRRNGIGTVDLVGLRDGQGAARLPTGAQEAAIAAAVAALQPLGVESRVVTPVAEVVDCVLELTVLRRPQYAFDWNDDDLPTVSSYDAANRIVTTALDLPSDFGPGDRIVFQGDGRVFLVGALVASDEFVLAAEDPELLDYTPAPATEIYAGGPMTELVRQAVLNGFSQSQARLTGFTEVSADEVPVPGINQLGPANEEDRYGGGWLDTVEESRLVAAAVSVPGVYRAAVSGLEVDAVAVLDGIARPSDPAIAGAVPEETTTIGLLIAGAVVVRRSRLP